MLHRHQFVVEVAELPFECHAVVGCGLPYTAANLLHTRQISRRDVVPETTGCILALEPRCSHVGFRASAVAALNAPHHLGSRSLSRHISFLVLFLCLLQLIP
jgi:hypothetical protein